MSMIAAATDIYSVVSGTSDYIAVSTRKFCVNPIQESAEYMRACGDIASGVGTVAHGINSVAGQYVSLVRDVYGAEPSHWATGSVSKMNAIGKFLV